MPTYIGFLRAVNLGKRQYPMAELRTALEDAGFTDVATHIQSGNVRVSTLKRSTNAVAAELERVFAADRGFEVPTVVLTPDELRTVVADAAGLPVPDFAHYVELLRDEPDAEARALIEGQDHPGQRAVVRGRAVHLLYDISYHEAKMPSAAVRRALGVCTNRNVKVLRALSDMWGT